MTDTDTALKLLADLTDELRLLKKAVRHLRQRQVDMQREIDNLYDDEEAECN